MIDEVALMHSQLMHLAIKVNEKEINAMMDIWAIHTFVSTRLVQPYELAMSKCSSFIKLVNAKAQAVVMIAYNVFLIIKNRSRKAHKMEI
ncbi:conserved hypothetical protein [Ricinus communis]|uniref:Uncharacterized protein n=1 Tax=Ricinus communis TaxID=3988 RepID=B9SDR1_RICCO|nr:conserved hypothetical protein [Ricinus communis]